MCNELYLSSAWEERLMLQQLPKDAPERPHVHTLRVHGGPEEQLRRAVPQRDHPRSVAALLRRGLCYKSVTRVTHVSRGKS